MLVNIAISIAVKKIDIHKVSLDKGKTLFAQRFPDEAKYFFKFLQLLSVEEINKGKEIGEKRQLKYLHMLTVFLSHVKKPVNKLTKDDLTKLIQALRDNTI